MGFADDAAVIAYVVSAVRDELARFKASAAGRPQLVANPVPTGNATLTWGLWVAAGIVVAAVVVAALQNAEAQRRTETSLAARYCDC